MAIDSRHNQNVSGATLTETLERLSRDALGLQISLGEIVDALREKAHGGLILVFALPNLTPLPPGASAILGIPLIVLAVQLMLGVRPWLPERLSRRTVKRATLARILVRLGPWLGRAERLLKPRWSGLLAGPGERIVGGLCVLLAIVLALPVPLGNLPPAVALCLFALGLLERDGFFIAAGFLAALFALAAAVAGLLVIAKAAQLLFDRWIVA